MYNMQVCDIKNFIGSKQFLLVNQAHKIAVTTGLHINSTQHCMVPTRANACDEQGSYMYIPQNIHVGVPVKVSTYFWNVWCMAPDPQAKHSIFSLLLPHLHFTTTVALQGVSGHG